MSPSESSSPNVPKSDSPSAGGDRHSKPFTQSKKELWTRYPVVQTLTRWLYASIMDSHWYWFLAKDGAKFREQTEARVGAWMKQSLPEYMHDDVVPKFCESLKVHLVFGLRCSAFC